MKFLTRSEVARPASIAERAIGSERNRSTRPDFRSSAIPIAVVVDPKIAFWMMIPGIRYIVYVEKPDRKDDVAAEHVDEQQDEHHRLHQLEHEDRRDPHDLRQVPPRDDETVEERQHRSIRGHGLLHGDGAHRSLLLPRFFGSGSAASSSSSSAISAA